MISKIKFDAIDGFSSTPYNLQEELNIDGQVISSAEILCEGLSSSFSINIK